MLKMVINLNKISTNVKKKTGTVKVKFKKINNAIMENRNSIIDEVQ